MHIISSDFDLQKIMESGQCFRMKKVGNVYRLIAHERVLLLEQANDGVILSCSEEEYASLWRRYFDLDTDYAAFRNAIPKEDTYLTEAACFGTGIRILAQDPWETLVTFLISQRKNIPAIQKAVEEICRRFGRPIEENAFAFPTPQAIASLSRADLDACSLGYRSPYVLSAAKMAADGTLDLDALGALDNDALRAALQTVPGVGIKVASCTALFGFHRLSDFPRDVWINRVLKEQYADEFPLERYEGFAGVIQQYLFFYARSMAHAKKPAV